MYNDEPITPPKTPHLNKMLQSGIRTWYAKFQNAVDNADGTPENFFSSISQVKSRNVDMWLAPAGMLLCHQVSAQGKSSWFTVAAGNIAFCKHINE